MEAKRSRHRHRPLVDCGGCWCRYGDTPPWVADRCRRYTDCRGRGGDGGAIAAGAGPPSTARHGVWATNEFAAVGRLGFDIATIAGFIFISCAERTSPAETMMPLYDTRDSLVAVKSCSDSLML